MVFKSQKPSQSLNQKRTFLWKMSVAGGGWGRAIWMGVFCLAPSPAARCTPWHPTAMGSDPAGAGTGLLARRPPPGRQQSLRRGLPCPSSDSSWQLWHNVLLTAVLLINGEHVCVAGTFLFLFSSSSVWWTHRKTVYIHYKRGGGRGFTIFLSQRFPLPQINPFWEQALV